MNRKWAAHQPFTGATRAWSNAVSGAAPRLSTRLQLHLLPGRTKRLIEILEILVGQSQIERSAVLVHMSGIAGLGKNHDPFLA